VPGTGIVKGKVETSLDFFENKTGPISTLCKEILELVRSKTQISYKIVEPNPLDTSVTKKNRSALLNVRMVLSCFGIYSEYKSTARRSLTGRKKNERFVEAFLEIDEETQKFRMAIAKLDPETGESNIDSYAKFFPNYFQ
jgi:hypothetical protein